MKNKIKIRKIGSAWYWSSSPCNWFYGGTWENTVRIVFKIWLPRKSRQVMKIGTKSVLFEGAA